MVDVGRMLVEWRERTKKTQVDFARELGISASNLRFYESGRMKDTLPGDLAVRLADVMAPYGVEREAVMELMLPPQARGLADVDAERWQPDFRGESLRLAIEALREGLPNRHPWQMRGRALKAAGVRPGDVLIIDHDRLEPRDGAIVCAQVADAAGEARTVMRLFRPPVLLAADAEAGPPVPLAQATVMGTAVAVIRQLD